MNLVSIGRRGGMMQVGDRPLYRVRLPVLRCRPAQPMLCCSGFFALLLLIGLVFLCFSQRPAMGSEAGIQREFALIQGKALRYEARSSE